MIKMVRFAVPNAEVKANRDEVRHKYDFKPSPQILPDLVVYYPGYKDAVGDYLAKFEGKEIAHHEMAKYIYEYAKHKEGLGIKIANILFEIYKKGLNAVYDSEFRIIINGKGYDFEKFKTAIHWLVVQEEINYPIDKGKMSINLPFSRYIEAIIAADSDDSIIHIDKVCARAKSKIPLKILQDNDTKLTPSSISTELFKSAVIINEGNICYE